MTNHAEVCYQDIVGMINLLPPPLTIEKVMEAFRDAVSTYFETLPVAVIRGSSASSPKPSKSSPSKSPAANWQAIINSTEYGLVKHFPAEWAELVAEFPKMNHLGRISLLRDRVEQDEKGWKKYIGKIRKIRPDLPDVIPVRKPKSPIASLETVTTPAKGDTPSDVEIAPKSKKSVAKGTVRQVEYDSTDENPVEKPTKAKRGKPLVTTDEF